MTRDRHTGYLAKALGSNLGIELNLDAVFTAVFLDGETIAGSIMGIGKHDSHTARGEPRRPVLYQAMERPVIELVPLDPVLRVNGLISKFFTINLVSERKDS